MMRRLVDLEGLEPPAPWFEAKCSIQLSYRSGTARVRRLRARGKEQGAKLENLKPPRCGVLTARGLSGELRASAGFTGKET